MAAGDFTSPGEAMTRLYKSKLLLLLEVSAGEKTVLVRSGVGDFNVKETSASLPTDSSSTSWIRRGVT